VADLSLPPGPASSGDQSRGQIILIAAFALAVAFVALALVTNSAIFAENLASRGETSGTADAAAYQYEVRQNIGAAMAYANRYNNSSHSTVETALNKSVLNQSGKLADQRAVNSRVTSIEGVTVTDEGTIIRQTADRNFTNDTTEEQWSLAKEVGRTRAFTITIANKTSLDSPSGNPFRVRVEDHAGTNDTHWKINLTHKTTGGDDDVLLRVDHPAIGPDTCRVEDVSGPVTVDVTGARLNGTYCGALEYNGSASTPTHYAAGISSPYNISYENGGNINGTYSLVVNDSTLGTTANYDGVPEMQVNDAVYAAKVDLNYSTESLTYESRIRVAPGEPE
jgi:hypothetical protein